jgi:hypothetical protein
LTNQAKLATGLVVFMLLYLASYGLLRIGNVLVHQSNYQWPEWKKRSNGYGHSIVTRSAFLAAAYSPPAEIEEALWSLSTGGDGEAR